jgi:hypothetical protein
MNNNNIISQNSLGIIIYHPEILAGNHSLVTYQCRLLVYIFFFEGVKTHTQQKN